MPVDAPPAASRHLRHLQHVFPNPTLTFCPHIVLVLHTCLSNTETFLHKDLTKPQEALFWQQKEELQPLVPLKNVRLNLLVYYSLEQQLLPYLKKKKESRLPKDFSCCVFNAIKSRSANLQDLRLLLLLLQQQSPQSIL